MSGSPDTAEQVVRTAARSAWLAATMGAAGLVLYNWWIAAWFKGILPTPNMMFSDLEVSGGQYERTLTTVDLIAGALILGALILAGSMGRRREWWLLIGFALAELAGALLPYSCPEALNGACRRAEWHFQLPAAHYGHIGAGVLEFGFATAAIWLSRRRLRGRTTQWARLAAGLWLAMVVLYPLIAITYLSDHAMAYVEPPFLLAFSVRIMMALLEPATHD